MYIYMDSRFPSLDDFERKHLDIVLETSMDQLPIQDSSRRSTQIPSIVSRIAAATAHLRAPFATGGGAMQIWQILATRGNMNGICGNVCVLKQNVAAQNVGDLLHFTSVKTNVCPDPVWKPVKKARPPATSGTAVAPTLKPRTATSSRLRKTAVFYNVGRLTPSIDWTIAS